MTHTDNVSLVLTTEGELSSVILPEYASGKQLDAMKKAIGVEWVDRIGLPRGIDIWVDDEGLINGSAINEVGTAFLASIGGVQPIAGNMLFAGLAGEDGATTVNLTPEQQDLIVRRLTDITDAFKGLVQFTNKLDGAQS